jgi:dipeptidase E
VEMVGKGAKIAVIANSRDSFDETRKNARTKECLDYLDSIGLCAEALDLRDYFHDNLALETELAKMNGVWLLGGNAFVLRKAFRQAGLDTLLPKLIRTNQLVYGGFSAAGCVLGPSLHGVELVDEEHLDCEPYQDETVWEGLGLLDYAFVPHYKSDHPESANIDKYVAYLQQNNMPYEALHDGEVIIIDSKAE